MKREGFTLIELLIAIMVIGILAAVAISSYQNFLIRSRVATGIKVATSALAAVTEYSITNNVLPKTQDQTGYESPIANTSVESIIINEGGEVVISYTALAGGGTIIFSPTLQGNGDVTWSCTGGTLQSTYRPFNCRH